MCSHWGLAQAYGLIDLRAKKTVESWHQQPQVAAEALCCVVRTELSEAFRALVSGRCSVGEAARLPFEATATNCHRPQANNSNKKKDGSGRTLKDLTRTPNNKATLTWLHKMHHGGKMTFFCHKHCE